MTLTAALLLSISLSAPGGAAAPAAEPVAAEAEAVSPLTTLQTPPGSKEDQALWELGRARNALLRRARDESTRLQSRLLVRGTAAKLEARAKQEGPAGDQAREVSARVSRARAANIEVLTGLWPVDPIRTCGYPLLDFEAQLHTQAAGGNRSLYEPLRRKLVDCLDRAKRILDAMDKVNQDFEAAIVEAEGLTATKDAVILRPKAAPSTRPGDDPHERHEAHEKKEAHERREEREEERR